jgi:hypothetical protein
MHYPHLQPHRSRSPPVLPIASFTGNPCLSFVDTSRSFRIPDRQSITALVIRNSNATRKRASLRQNGTSQARNPNDLLSPTRQMYGNFDGSPDTLPSHRRQQNRTEPPSPATMLRPLPVPVRTFVLRSAYRACSSSCQDMDRIQGG